MFIKFFNLSKKTWKKIANTQKLTNNKLILIQKKQSFVNQRADLKEVRKQEIEVKKQINKNMKAELEESLKLKRELKLNQINEESKLLKEQKEYNKRLINYIKQEELINNKNKFATVKNQKIVSEEKRKEIDVILSLINFFNFKERKERKKNSRSRKTINGRIKIKGRCRCNSFCFIKV